MDVEVKYSASSNISYRGSWTLTVDDEDWVDMTDADRDSLIEELALECLHDDISLSWKS